MTTLANEAFKSQTGYTDFKAWKADLEKKSTTSEYWFTVIEFEKLLLIFLRSLRESKFDLFIRCFEEMLPWLAALNHIHYLRWELVFLNDIFEEAFVQGNFTVKKTSRVFFFHGD